MRETSSNVKYAQCFPISEYVRWFTVFICTRIGGRKTNYHFHFLFNDFWNNCCWIIICWRFLIFFTLGRANRRHKRTNYNNFFQYQLNNLNLWIWKLFCCLFMEITQCFGGKTKRLAATNNITRWFSTLRMQPISTNAMFLLLYQWFPTEAPRHTRMQPFKTFQLPLSLFLSLGVSQNTNIT